MILKWKYVKYAVCLNMTNGFKQSPGFTSSYFNRSSDSFASQMSDLVIAAVHVYLCLLPKYVIRYVSRVSNVVTPLSTPNPSPTFFFFGVVGGGRKGGYSSNIIIINTELRQL